MTKGRRSSPGVRVVFGAFVLPLQEGAKSRAAMAVVRLFLGDEFGEGLADFREVKQRIVAEAIFAARRTQNHAFSFAVESGQRVSVAGGGNHADEAPGAIFVGNIMQLAQ